VKIQVVSGALTVTVLGEAQQDGRLGQNVLVQNVDSKKVLTARVTGPGVVEVELGGGP
jgi:flagella basal body P-ring formation protein FlgA